MTTIPSEWQTLLGGPVLTGHCCTSIISNQSWGPALSVFDPANLGISATTPSIPLVYYNATHPTLGVWSNTTIANPTFNMSSTATGVVFPTGTRSVLVFGSTGTGVPCYGDGGPCGDQANSYKGTHAYPYTYYVWAYDANDLLAVKNGTKNPWDVRPYTTWGFTLPFSTTSDFNIINGVAYNPITKKLYIAQKNGDGARPVIHVFRVNF